MNLRALVLSLAGVYITVVIIAMIAGVASSAIMDWASLVGLWIAMLIIID